ncbi:MAG: FdtA/QdtA family cupin domain-containing protein [Muribaculaceae bacterium]|nr:FdtA/QdtA family cupin domain-containing protein [Muribaculaceae bacterium]
MPRKRAEIIRIPRIEDPRGNLSFIEHSAKGVLPFAPQRVYWIYDVPGGRERHGHAFRRGEELIVALSGSFDVVLTDPDGLEITHRLARSYYGVYVPAGTWRALRNFSSNSVAMVLSSTHYDADDYIEDFNEYITFAEAPEKDGETPSEAAASTCKPAPTADSHLTSRLADCRIIDLARHRHANGSLSVAQNTPDHPFHIKRAFYLYDVPAGAERGGHSHFEAEELIMSVSGAFDVVLSDGAATRTFTLSRPYQALYVPAGIWRELNNFSGGSVCLVLTSENYLEADYCRDPEEFKRLTAGK